MLRIIGAGIVAIALLAVGTVRWLDTPIAGSGLAIQDTVERLVREGDCFEALDLTQDALIANVVQYEALFIWLVETSSCSTHQYVFGGGWHAEWMLRSEYERQDAANRLAQAKLSDRLRLWETLAHAYAPSSINPFEIWQRLVFSNRCYWAFLELGLPNELSLREEFVRQGWDSAAMEGPWRARAERCSALAIALHEQAVRRPDDLPGWRLHGSKMLW